MAEVGSVRFAQVALGVARGIVPAYRTTFSERRFTRPLLLATLPPMRDEDGTFREAEVRPAARGLVSAPGHTARYRFMRRLAASDLQPPLVAVVSRMPAAGAGAVVAADATGLAPGAISTSVVNRRRARGEGSPWRRWRGWPVAVDGGRQLARPQIAQRGPTDDAATLRPLGATGQQVGAIEAVLADGEVGSGRTHRFIRGAGGAVSITPARRGKAGGTKRGVRAERAARFPAGAYGQRSAVEGVSCAAKRKGSARAPGRSLATERLQAPLLGVASDVYRPWRAPTPMSGGSAFTHSTRGCQQSRIISKARGGDYPAPARARSSASRTTLIRSRSRLRYPCRS